MSDNAENAATTVVAPDGARVAAWSRGGQLTSWIPAGGEDRLFLSDITEFGPGVAFRGGVPVIFPQFGGFGPLPGHGFARGLPWALTQAGIEGGEGVVAYCLTDDVYTRSLWNHAFEVTVTARFRGDRLTVTLGVTNTGGQPFTFTAALHTYFRVDELARTTIEGLGGLRYRDHTRNDVHDIQREPVLSFSGEVDRIYENAPAVLHIVEPRRRLRVEAKNFPDAVVWTPWESPRGIKNLQPGGFRRFICLEAAVITAPVSLAPGASWAGAQTMTALGGAQAA